MIQKLAQPEIPSPYWVAIDHYRCGSCAATFDWRSASGGEIVRFLSPDGREEAWLPTYGPGGYLDLIGKLVPGFGPSSEITIRVTRQFTERFTALQREGGMTPLFTLDERGPTCPVCGSGNLHLDERQVVTNPPLTWLRIPEGG
jgi:hypothetical protein